MKLNLALGGRGASQGMEIVGDWVTTPTDAKDGLVEVACQLSSVEVRLAAEGSGTGAPSAGEDPSRAERELAESFAAVRFFASYEASGAAVAFWFPRGTNPSVANLLITLVGEQQLVRSAPGDTAWVVHEHDANGEYLAAYQEVAPGRFDKRKARYIEADGLIAAQVAGPVAGVGVGTDSTLRPVVRVDRSKFDLRADGRGRLIALRGGEGLTVELGTAGLAMRTSVDIELAEGQVTNDLASVGAFAREQARLVAQPMQQMRLDSKAERARRDRLVLGGADLGALRQELVALPDDALPSGPRVASLRRRLEALFRTDAAAAARAPELVRALAPERAKLLLDALSLAASNASQSALGAIARDAAVLKAARQYAVQYMGHQEEPSQEAVTAVASLLDDRDPQLRQMARLTYGACANRLRATDRARSQRIVDDLLSRLWRTAAERDRSDRIDLTMALGNAGDPSSLPSLRELMNGDEIRVRAAAVDALRFIDNPEVDPLLTSLLQSPDDPIRLAVIDAIRFRPVGPFAVTLADVARKDPTPGVRNAAVALVGARLAQLPSLRPILEDVQKHDREEKNRALAARYLAPASRPSSVQ
jgi:HEAT repeat protein